MSSAIKMATPNFFLRTTTSLTGKLTNPNRKNMQILQRNQNSKRQGEKIKDDRYRESSSNRVSIAETGSVQTWKPGLKESTRTFYTQNLYRWIPKALCLPRPNWQPSLEPRVSAAKPTGKAVSKKWPLPIKQQAVLFLLQSCLENSRFCQQMRMQQSMNRLTCPMGFV